MAENNLDAANQLITQAESLDVQYNPLYLGDTPRKLRRELDKRYQAAGRMPTSSGRNGRLADAGPSDPFTGRYNDAAGSYPADPKSIAKSHILNARKELSRGNLPGATYWYTKATEQPATFGPNEDSPERLADEIRRMGGRLDDVRSRLSGSDRGITRLPPVDDPRQFTPGMDRGYAARGVEGTGRMSNTNPGADPLWEARQLLAVGDVRRASQKVQQARASGIRYGVLDDNPEKVDAAITAYGDLMSQKAERGTTESWRRQYAKQLMDQAGALLRWRDYAEAERLATEAARTRVNFNPYEDRPEMVLDKIAAARRQARGSAMPENSSGVVPASGEYVSPATGADYDRRAASAVYDQSTDRTQNVLATSEQPSAPLSVDPSASAMSLFDQGEAALRAHDTRTASEYFRRAYARVQELDPVTARRLQDHLQMLASAGAAQNRAPAPQSGMLDDASVKQQLAARQLAAEVSAQERAADKLRETDPQAAIANLEQLRRKVESAAVDRNPKELLLRRIDRALTDTRKFAEDNRSRIGQDQQNKKVLQDRDHENQAKLDIQNKMAQKIDEFNTLMHERRFDEAEVVAKQAMELDPRNPVAQQCVTEAKLIRNYAAAMDIRDRKEEGYVRAMESVEESIIPIDDRKPCQYPDVKAWKELTGRRSRYAKEQGRKMSERELELQQKLKTPVSVRFEATPLAKVIDHLGGLAGVSFYMDPQGLAEQGVATENPVTIDLRNEIKLESALNLILQPLHLSYVIKDEVIKITSEQYKNVQVYQHVYNVADLVVPIPNFVPHNGIGLDGAYKHAMARALGGGGASLGNSAISPIAMVASHEGRGTAALDPTLLAQMGGGSHSAVPSTSAAGGPSNLGGGSMADFDSLIDLITTTIQPTSWDAVGGPGTISPFETNLSLVVSQTQEIHEEISDLLDQLRRLQDLQVTIEVRFITLNDNFFERIGVDFDFKINDRINGANPNGSFGASTSPGGGPPYNVSNTLYREQGKDRSMTLGLQAPNTFTTDLDIPFTQDSYTLAVPQFGGFNPSAGLSTGFAILSEIEAYFFINAAQGDVRSNVLQAPKVTLFNGQMAMIMDQSSTPFVISVIPVVGEFAAAQQPVIVILNEGTMLTVQAVVSSDRRFVRLTVIPFFSHIVKVDTFTFTGSQTSTNTSSQEGNQDTPNDASKKAAGNTTTTQGTTLQLPTFAYVSVSTTVSVPDGGTVLLGGIKRLSEGRNEFGRADPQQAPVHQPSLQERRHRTRNLQPDADGHSADHHPGGRRRETRSNANHPVANPEKSSLGRPSWADRSPRWPLSLTRGAVTHEPWQRDDAPPLRLWLAGYG